MIMKKALREQGRKPGTKCGGRPVQGVWGQKSPVGSRGEAPVGGLGMRSTRS